MNQVAWWTLRLRCTNEYSVWLLIKTLTCINYVINLDDQWLISSHNALMKSISRMIDLISVPCHWLNHSSRWLMFDNQRMFSPFMTCNYFINQRDWWSINVCFMTLPMLGCSVHMLLPPWHHHVMNMWHVLTPLFSYLRWQLFWLASAVDSAAASLPREGAWRN